METIQGERRHVEYVLARQRDTQREDLRWEIACIEARRQRYERALRLPLRNKMRSRILHKIANGHAQENNLIEQLHSL